MAPLIAAPFLIGAVWPWVSPPEAVPATTEFRIADHLVNESSGLVVVEEAGSGDPLVVTINDSGDDGNVYVLDPATGERVGLTRFEPRPRDVEALAPASSGPDGEPHVWVGDIGDNWGLRPSLVLTRVPVGVGEIETSVLQRLRVAYPDGPRDAEALVRHPVTGQLFVLSKDEFGGAMYAVPRHLTETAEPFEPADANPTQVHMMEWFGSTPPTITDAAFTHDGKALWVRNYTHLWLLAFPSLEPLSHERLPRQVQGEGLAVAPSGDLLISTEGRNSLVERLPAPRP